MQCTVCDAGTGFSVILIVQASVHLIVQASVQLGDRVKWCELAGGAHWPVWSYSHFGATQGSSSTDGHTLHAVTHTSERIILLATKKSYKLCGSLRLELYIYQNPWHLSPELHSYHVDYGYSCTDIIIARITKNIKEIEAINIKDSQLSISY